VGFTHTCIFNIVKSGLSGILHDEGMSYDSRVSIFGFKLSVESVECRAK
jgi:hypothetical protein